jgi:hypothetical protein
MRHLLLLIEKMKMAKLLIQQYVVEISKLDLGLKVCLDLDNL